MGVTEFLLVRFDLYIHVAWQLQRNWNILKLLLDERHFR